MIYDSKENLKYVLPCYLFKKNKELFKNTQSLNNYKDDKKSEPFFDWLEIREQVNIGLQFRDGRMLMFEPAFEGLIIQQEFNSPVKEESFPLFYTKFIVRWDDIPGEEVSNHINIARRKETKDEILIGLPDLNKRIFLKTPYAWIYIVYQTGGDISIKVLNPGVIENHHLTEIKIGFIGEGVQWRSYARDLEPIYDRFQKKYPIRMFLWNLYSLFPEISPISFLKKENKHE